MFLHNIKDIINKETLREKEVIITVVHVNNLINLLYKGNLKEIKVLLVEDHRLTQEDKLQDLLNLYNLYLNPKKNICLDVNRNLIRVWMLKDREVKVNPQGIHNNHTFNRENLKLLVLEKRVRKDLEG